MSHAFTPTLMKVESHVRGTAGYTLASVDGEGAKETVASNRQGETKVKLLLDAVMPIICVTKRRLLLHFCLVVWK